MRTKSSKATEALIEDLRKILGMIEVINKYQQKGLTLKACLSQLGQLAHLRFNDKKDPESCYIRNKYGYIQRNKGSKINPNGIYFEQIRRLVFILKADDALITEADQHKLECGIEDLKHILGGIIQQEAVFITANPLPSYTAPTVPNQHPGAIKNVFDYVKTHYYHLVIAHTMREFTLLDRFDFSKREDRYFLARVLTTTGELMHELMEDKDAPATTLTTVFTLMNNIRNKLVHKHTAILKGSEDSNLVGHIQTIIQLFSTLDQHHNSAEEITKLEKALGEFHKFMEHKSEKANQKSTTRKEFVIKEQNTIHKLKQCIIDGINLVEITRDLKPGQRIPKRYKNSESKLAQKNTQYKQLLEQLSSETKQDFPSEFSLQTLKQCKTIKEGFSIDASHRKKVQQQESEQAEITRKQTNTNKWLHKIDCELNYLACVEANQELPQHKKEYIKIHIGTIVGEYADHIMGDSDPNLRPFMSQTMLYGANAALNSRKQGLAHNIFAFNPAEYFQTLHVTIVPSQGDIQAVKMVYKDNISPPGFKKAKLLCEVGDALTRLCDYDRAIARYQEAIADLSALYHVSANALNQRTNREQYKLDSTGITQPAAILIDVMQELLGIDSYDLKIQNDLANAYVRNGQLPEALNCLKLDIDMKSVASLQSVDLIIQNKVASSVLEEETTSEVIEKLRSIFKKIKKTDATYVVFHPGRDAALKQIALRFNLLGEIYCSMHKPSVALDYFQKAAELTPCCSQYVSSCINYAGCLHNLNQLPEATSTLKQLLEDGNISDEHRFHCLKFLCAITLDSPGDKDINNYLDEMQNFVEKHSSQLVSVHGDRRPLYDLVIHNMRLRQLYLTEVALATVQEKINKGKDILAKLPADKPFSERATFYCVASKVLTGLIKDNRTTPNWREILRCAEEWFILAVDYSAARPSDLRSAACALALAFSNGALSNPCENYLDLMRKCRDLQQKYQLDTSTTDFNIACYNHNCAEKLYAVDQLEQAVPFYRQAIAVLENIHWQLPRAKRELAMSYEGLGDCLVNLSHLQQANRYYKDYFAFSRDGSNDCETKKLYRECLKKTVRQVKKLRRGGQIIE